MTLSRRLLGDGLWAVTDQALFAGSNFLLNLLLVRWLEDSGYGAFSVAYAVFLFVSLGFTALVIEPMLVFGANRWRTAATAYLREILVLLGKLSLISAVVHGILGLAAGAFEVAEDLRGPLFTLTIAGPLVLLQWTLRRFCYVVDQVRVAAVAGTIYLVTLIGLAIGVRQVSLLSPSSAIAVMAVASVISIGYLLWRIGRQQDQRNDSGYRPTTAEIQRSHWNYGRWLWISGILGWVAGDMLYLVLATRHGLAASGHLRASFNLIMPALHALSALGVVAVPRFVRAIEGGLKVQQVLRWWGITIALAAAYSLAIAVLAGPVLAIAYGERFVELKPLVMILALLPIAAATQGALATVLRAMERSKDLLLSSLVTVAVAATVGVVLTLTHGMRGAAMGFVISNLVNACVVGWRLRLAMSRDAASA